MKETKEQRDHHRVMIEIPGPESQGRTFWRNFRSFLLKYSTMTTGEFVYQAILDRMEKIKAIEEDKER